MRPTTQVSAYRCLRFYAWVSSCILTETFKLDSKSVRLTSSIGSGVLPKCLLLCSWIAFKGCITDAIKQFGKQRTRVLLLRYLSSSENERNMT